MEWCDSLEERWGSLEEVSFEGWWEDSLPSFWRGSFDDEWLSFDEWWPSLEDDLDSLPTDEVDELVGAILPFE